MVPVHAGQVIEDKYRIDRKLGEGGMGIVFAATDLRLQRTVAIKFMTQADADRDRLQRFMREVKATANLKGPHVARTLDTGWLDDETPFLVLEYVDGETLSKWLSRSGPLPVGDAVACALCACDALAEAHALGIVHRDLKPSNMLVTRRDPITVKLIDFGVSKVLSSGEPSLTGTDCVIGSPSCASPEQIATPKDVDARADIWGLGVTLYTLLTACSPFGADSAAETYRRILYDTPSPLRALRAEIPRKLETIVARCLRKERSERFSDVRALAAALLPFASDRVLHPGAPGVASTLASDEAETQCDRPPTSQLPTAVSGCHVSISLDGPRASIQHGQADAGTMELSAIGSDPALAPTLFANPSPRPLAPSGGHPQPEPMLPVYPHHLQDVIEGVMRPLASGTASPSGNQALDHEGARSRDRGDRHWSAGVVLTAVALFIFTFGGTLAWRYGVPRSPRKVASRSFAAPPPTAIAAARSGAAPLAGATGMAPPAGPTSAGAAPSALATREASPMPPPNKATGPSRKPVKPLDGKAPTSQAPDCSESPFFVDSEGIKSVRPECR